MITRITKENAKQYRALFADAVLALQTHDDSYNPIPAGSSVEPILKPEVTYKEVILTEETYIDGYHYIFNENEWKLTNIGEEFKPEQRYAIKEENDSITTLEEYFHYIADLRAIDKKFIILPLEDEENFFHVDANSRIITVPEAFVKNGISVQGDDIAEMLYFKIDRYFDMDDLGEKNAFIEWRLPADPENPNSERMTGVSVPYVLDNNVAPGYVVVGWPIGANLTKFPGQIEFALRFYDSIEEGAVEKLVYSFATMPATAEIKSSLNLDLSTIIADGSALNSEGQINDRLENSELPNDNSPTPVTPVFVDVDVEHMFGDSVHSAEKMEEKLNGYDVYKVYMTDPATGVEKSGNYTVQAVITDTGRLSYAWIKRDSQNEVVLDYKGGEPNAYVEVDYSSEPKADRTYYTLTEEGIAVEFEFGGEVNNFQEAQAKGIQLYERKATIIMNVTYEDDEKEYPPILGTYQARAINRLGRKTARAYSPIALVEGPNIPVIDEEKFSSSEIFEDLKATISVVAETDAHAYNTYKLYQTTESGDTLIASNNSGTFEIEGVAYDENNKEADLKDGYYYVIVESLLNRTTESDTTDQIRVTYPASPVAIKLNDPTYNVGGVVRYDVDKPLEVTITLHPSEENKRVEGVDEIRYQWYEYKAPQGNEEQIRLDLEAAAKGTYQVSVLDELITGATTSVLNIKNTEANEEGMYFCQITNVYNGTEYVQCSKFFDVIDTKFVAQS